MFETTMTGSFYRTPEIEELLKKSPTGEVGGEGQKAVEAAEKLAISDQLHPNGAKAGLTWVSNGEQRKSGYTTYIPNRFTGFSTKERVSQNFSPEFFRRLLKRTRSLPRHCKKPGPLIYRK
ncbi:methionine synthase [mine drainage metagenome]|uniref:Methionine synthase n=1 Tax=mine drainage metagenome TaxID=410659 RepID=T0Y4V3_9ZZZZ